MKSLFSIFDFSDVKKNNNIQKLPISYSHEEIDRIYNDIDRNKKKLVLGVTSGRSGMKWVFEIFRKHKNAEGGCERNAEAEAFYRYIKFHNLKIDTEGIFDITKREILKDWLVADISITVSPYFSHSAYYVYKKLNADRIIWGITDPKFTVTSFFNKNWYKNDISYNDLNKVPGYQPDLKERWSHFLGRLIPSGSFYNEWKSLTRIGKISWFLNMINKEIFSNILKIPKDKVWIFRLEEADQNYEYYIKMAKEFELKPLLSKKVFLSIKKIATKKGENDIIEWSAKEKEEFYNYTKDYREIYDKVKSNKLFFL